MKLFKLSLSALIATGSFSSLSAAPLEDAIKGIDISGYGRYRFQSDTYKTNAAGGLENSNFSGFNGNKNSRFRDNIHRFSLDVNFKATLDDNFFALIGLRYDTKDLVGSHAYDASGITNTHGGLTARGVNYGWGAKGYDSFSIRQYYVGFSGIDYTTILAGRMMAGTFFTDDIVGTGFKALVSPVEGLTLAGFFFTNFELDEHIGYLPIENPSYYPSSSGAYITQRNLWGLAAMYQNDMLDLQGWYAGLNKVANLFALNAGISYDINDDFSLRAKAQLAHTSLRGKFKDGHTDPSEPKAQSDMANSTFYAALIGASAYGFDIDAGYMSYGKKDKASLQVLEDKGRLITAGELLLNYTAFAGKHKSWFAKAKYTYDAYSLALEYVYDKAKNDKGIVGFKGSEWVIRTWYRYNDKLSFSAWYSIVSKKETSKDTLENGTKGYQKDKLNRFRFEARYNF